MKALLVTLALLGASPAVAFDFRATEEKLNEANYACFDGEDHDGTALSEGQIQAACLETIALLEQMSKNGYCYDKDRLQWWKCEAN